MVVCVRVQNLEVGDMDSVQWSLLVLGVVLLVAVLVVAMVALVALGVGRRGA